MKSSEQAAIRVENLVKIYDRKRTIPVRAVDDISFQVRSGEIFGLLGPNGAGKSTTIKVLTTLLGSTSGSVHVLGFNAEMDPLQIRKRICVVLQEDAIEQYLSVWNNFQNWDRESIIIVEVSLFCIFVLISFWFALKALDHAL
ncbi:MAG: ATP-binding cassette domain-containing protein [bacterium]